MRGKLTGGRVHAPKQHLNIRGRRLSHSHESDRWSAEVEPAMRPASAQRHDTGEALRLAWMNRAALTETLVTGRVCRGSRSRGCLWRKGQTSGHIQRLWEWRLDGEGDALLPMVEPTGPACHTGRTRGFYNAVRGERLEVISQPTQGIRA